MAIFKCKMCGGDLEVTGSVGTCQYCGTKQTLPRLDDDRRAALYDRANHFRRQNDFDKAAGIYETILAEDSTDAEAYWSLVLCAYGVEYVEDPKTKKRIPTCHRTRYISVLADENYKQALEYADESQRVIYEAEAATIDTIQKGILEVSNKEEPYDVFICYKETDESGNRTKDSLRAQEIYYQLEKEGYKIFFSRITLEDKLGHQYEPHIFAALNSAKVMLVVGTKPEHFNAVWVKNEWSRFLALMKENKDKLLIPCYSDMDPYDLPEELSLMQSQDMSKIGFVQDLIRGVKKVLGAKKNDEQAVSGQTVENLAVNSAERLIKNGNTFLELNDYTSALESFERATKEFPEDYRGWWGLIRCETGDLTQALEDYSRVETWFEYVKRLANEKEYHSIEAECIEYYRKIAIDKTSKEKEEIQKKLLDHKNRIHILEKKKGEFIQQRHSYFSNYEKMIFDKQNEPNETIQEISDKIKKEKLKEKRKFVSMFVTPLIISSLVFLLFLIVLITDDSSNDSTGLKVVVALISSLFYTTIPTIIGISIARMIRKRRLGLPKYNLKEINSHFENRIKEVEEEGYNPKEIFLSQKKEEYDKAMSWYDSQIKSVENNIKQSHTMIENCESLAEKESEISELILVELCNRLGINYQVSEAIEKIAILRKECLKN